MRKLCQSNMNMSATQTKSIFLFFTVHLLSIQKGKIVIPSEYLKKKGSIVKKGFPFYFDGSAMESSVDDDDDDGGDDGANFCAHFFAITRP